MDYALAKQALDKIAPHLELDEFEALSGLVALFEPYDGDDPDEARARHHADGHCANCGYQAPILFFPAPAEQEATAALRLSQCPRCFSTRMMCGAASKETE